MGGGVSLVRVLFKKGDEGGVNRKEGRKGRERKIGRGVEARGGKKNLRVSLPNVAFTSKGSCNQHRLASAAHQLQGFRADRSDSKRANRQSAFIEEGDKLD